MQSSTEVWFHLESKNWSNSKVTHLRSLTSITFKVGGRSRWVQTSRLHRTTDLRRIVFFRSSPSKTLCCRDKSEYFFQQVYKKSIDARDESMTSRRKLKRSHFDWVLSRNFWASRHISTPTGRLRASLSQSRRQSRRVCRLGKISVTGNISF